MSEGAEFTVDPRETSSYPEAITSGQNFFDQEPFKTLINKHGKGELDNLLGHVITNQLVASKTISKNEEFNDYFIDKSKVRTNLSWLDNQIIKRYDIDPSRKNEVVESAYQLFNDLEHFPRWSEYILSNFDKVFYNPDGSFKEKTYTKMNYSPVKTYLSWLPAQQMIGLQSVLKDAFPQDLGQSSIVEVIRQFGSGIPRRDWATKAAAETTAPKK